MWRAALVTLGGCSFMFMSLHEPADRCTAQLEAPVTDTVIAGSSVAFLGAETIAYAMNPSEHDIDEHVALIALVPLVLLYGASAVYGYTARSRCLRAAR